MMLSANNKIQTTVIFSLNNERTAALGNEQNLNGVYLHIVGRMMTASVRLGA